MAKLIQNWVKGSSSLHAEEWIWKVTDHARLDVYTYDNKSWYFSVRWYGIGSCYARGHKTSRGAKTAAIKHLLHEANCRITDAFDVKEALKEGK